MKKGRIFLLLCSLLCTTFVTKNKSITNFALAESMSGQANICENAVTIKFLGWHDEYHRTALHDPVPGDCYFVYDHPSSVEFESDPVITTRLNPEEYAEEYAYASRYTTILTSVTPGVGVNASPHNLINDGLTCFNIYVTENRFVEITDINITYKSVDQNKDDSNTKITVLSGSRDNYSLNIDDTVLFEATRYHEYFETTSYSFPHNFMMNEDYSKNSRLYFYLALPGQNVSHTFEIESIKIKFLQVCTRANLSFTYDENNQIVPNSLKLYMACIIPERYSISARKNTITYSVGPDFSTQKKVENLIFGGLVNQFPNCLVGGIRFSVSKTNYDKKIRAYGMCETTLEGKTLTSYGNEKEVSVASLAAEYLEKYADDPSVIAAKDVLTYLKNQAAAA